MIRKIKFEDIEAIKEIDKKCFKINDARTTEGIKGYIEKSDFSSIVYEIDNEVVGYNFIHVWGAFAWFGPLGVNHEYQSQGIGKKLIEHTIKILKEEYKVSTIGLNTMPESSYNVGFYMNLGFTPLKLSLNLKKEIHDIELKKLKWCSKYIVKQIDIHDEVNFLNVKENLNMLTNKIFYNFNLSSELKMIKNEDFGTVFALEYNDKIQGILICYTKSIRESSEKNLQIKLAVIDRNLDYKEAIDAIMKACTQYAKNINYESISIDCNTYDTEICNYLISNHEFKIERNQIMMLMGKDNPFKSNMEILLTRFAG
ncbi:N-acetyltransferase [Clostridium sp. C2-6-12]|uniref:GNAT family N-acetyltransferase n=1 Tax=Clostridium sp. C2-6-12 TaxID=2698832 RepID=UPI00136CDBE2|nr:N-acetyltransferase [Clostridium sp. C2-6-12]